MAAVELRVQGLATLDAALRRLPQETQARLVGEALREPAELVRKAIAAATPRATGELARNVLVESEPQASGRGAVVRIGFPKKYAWRGWYLEAGTKPHRIPKLARRGRRRRGQKVLAGPGFGPRRSVQHPGIAPRRFIATAFAGTAQAALDLFGRRLWDRLRGFAQRVAA